MQDFFGFAGWHDFLVSGNPLAFKFNQVIKKRMLEDIDRILINEAAIAKRLAEMAQKITQDYHGRDLIVLSLLNGSLIFVADLLRLVPLPLRLVSLRVSSYAGTESSGQLSIANDRLTGLVGRDVLIVDDILDSGRTLHGVVGHLRANTEAASVKTCVLLDKNVQRAVPFNADYTGFQIPDAFVVGYGLDYNERYRNLPFIGVLKSEAITRYAI